MSDYFEQVLLFKHLILLTSWFNVKIISDDNDDSNDNNNNNSKNYSKNIHCNNVKNFENNKNNNNNDRKTIMIMKSLGRVAQGPYSQTYQIFNPLIGGMP